MMSAAAALASDPPHRREHLSVLADVEKRVLIWLAKRLPAWVTSDGLTDYATPNTFTPNVIAKSRRPRCH